MKSRKQNSSLINVGLKLFLVLALSVLPEMAFAQAVSARLVGSVQDSGQLKITTAHIQARNVDSGIVVESTTNESGEYNFPHIAPGRYTLTATAEGFGAVEIKDVFLQIGDAKSLNITLTPASVSQQVQVIESTPTVDTGSTQVGSVVDNRQAVELPLNGRDAMTLFFLQAGTNPLDNQVPSGSQQQTGVVDGLPPGTSEVRIEGILSINSSFDYAPSHPSFPVPSESVGEYRVSTSGNGADDGPASGAEVKTLIKSGTNSFRGTVFEFLRNTALDANQFFNKFNKSPGNQTQQAALHRNQFGFAIGGPIRKNKTFFFGTAEWQRQTQNDAEEASVYTQALRQGIFRYAIGTKNSTSLVNSQNGTPLVPYSTANLTTIDPNKQGFDTVYLPGLLEVMPLPNAWDVGDGFNTAGYRYQSSDIDNYWQGLIKIDHTLTQRHAFALTLSQYSENNPNSKMFDGVIAEGYTEVRKGLSLRLVSTLSPSLMNEVSVGGALRHAVRENTTTYCETPTTNITLTGLGTSLCDNRSTQGNPAVNEGFQDVLTKLVRSHTLEFGGEFWYETLNRVSGTRYPLINTSNSFNAAVIPALPGLNTTDRGDAAQWVKDLTGYVGSISQSFYLQRNGKYSEYSPLLEELRKHEWGFFAHDTWRIKKNLTINAGLRWDILPAVKNNDGYVYPTNGLSGALGVQGSGSPTTWSFAPNNGGNVYATDYHALAPSLGFTWDPFGNGKSAVRASYHLSNVRSMMISADFSELENGSSTSQTITPNINLSQLNTVLPLPLPQPFQTVPTTRQGSAVVSNPNLSTPYVQEWTFGLDREVLPGWRASATYVGNHAVGMWRSQDINQIQLNSNGFLQAFQIAQQNLAANGSPTKGQSLGNLQKLFSEVTAGQYTLITQGQAASLANALDTTVPSGGVAGGLVTSAGLPSTFFRYNPQFKDVWEVGNYGSSSWNGLKLEIDHKLSNGIRLQANYTFSKGFVDYPQDQEYFNTAAGAFRDNANHRLDRQISPLDSTHVVLINGLYELPFGRNKLLLSNVNGLVDGLLGGWQLNGIFGFTSGRPIPVTTGFLQLNQNVASAPNFNRSIKSFSNVNKSGSSVTFATPAQLAAAFTNPVAGSPGDFTIQNLHGPNYTNLDASLFKSFHLPKTGEKTRLQLRGEYFNVLNHANFKNPSSLNINSGSAGTLTSTYAARIGQLAAKIIF